MDKDLGVSDVRLRQAYQRTFVGEDGGLVLRDLKNRCFEYDTTLQHIPDAINFANEGKRQTMLHIKGMMSSEGMKAAIDEEEEEGM